MHEANWNKDIPISKNFILCKHNISIFSLNIKNKFDVIYFDAFAPNKQEEIWEEKNLKRMYSALKDKGFLITYCAKGIIKRRLRNIGFNIETLKGPPGKREMIRANKI